MPLEPHAHASLMSHIVASPAARQSHIFVARNYLDFMEGMADVNPVTISRYDDAEVKLGLGWRVRDPASGSEILGKDACTAFLNSLVKDLEAELCTTLRQYDRQRLIQALLANSETANWHRQHWRRTAAAVLVARRKHSSARVAVVNPNERG